jgi:hypothetical protein
MARRFLDMPWADQVDYMVRVLTETAAGIACTVMNHEGAVLFASRHTCHDRYAEGWQDALKELDRQLAKPKPADTPVLPGQVTVDTVLGE